MSTFKFNCPNCGQKILGDSSFSGRQFPCPACHQSLIIPKPSAATAAPVSPQSLAATMPLPSVGATRPEPKRLSRLAIVSLIGCPIPGVGIVCGHLAAWRIRRDPSLTGNVMATVGLVIGYFVLAALIVILVLKHTP